MTSGSTAVNVHLQDSQKNLWNDVVITPVQNLANPLGVYIYLIKIAIGYNTCFYLQTLDMAKVCKLIDLTKIRWNQMEVEYCIWTPNIQYSWEHMQQI